MPDNTVTLVGNLTRDPELRFTSSGQAQATLGIAVNRRWQNRQSGEWDEQTSFFNIVCWREMAENVAHSLQKGARVVVTGRLEQRSWESNGEKRSVVEVIADEIGPSLRWATASIEQQRAQGRRRVRRRQRRVAVAAAASVPNEDMSSSLRRRGAVLMARKAPRTKNKDNARRSKKKTSLLIQERVEYVDYKDVNLLRRFMSDRAKIRARRVTGNDAQQQREVARAIKNAREMALAAVHQPGHHVPGAARPRRLRWRPRPRRRSAAAPERAAAHGRPG